jgi:O-acetyl-ADP-ribose deacetylase (regulator of RNase III)
MSEEEKVLRSGRIRHLASVKSTKGKSKRSHPVIKVTPPSDAGSDTGSVYYNNSGSDSSDFGSEIKEEIINFEDFVSDFGRMAQVLAQDAQIAALEAQLVTAQAQIDALLQQNVVQIPLNNVQIPAPPQPFIFDPAPPIKIPVYNSATMTPPAFITTAEEYFLIRRTQSENTKLALITQMFLKDSDISRWWMETKREVSSWDEFKARFSDYENQGQSKDNLLTKLFSRKQKFSDPFETFCWDIYQGYRKIDPNVTQEQIIERIINSCIPEIAVMLRARTYITVSELICHSREMISDLNKIRRRGEKQLLLRAKQEDNVEEFNRNVKAKYFPAIAEQGTSQGRISVARQPAATERPSSSYQGQGQRSVECYNCHKIGHLAKDCRAPRSQVSYSQKSTHLSALGEPHPTAPTIIRYAKGDATRPILGNAPAIIAHICNDQGYWGKGFVMSISSRWAEPQLEYQKLGDKRRLGHVQLVKVPGGITVANMIAQGSPSERVPIRYNALRNCLRFLGQHALRTGSVLHMPKIGTGLARGDWNTISDIIQQEICYFGIQVIIYIKNEESGNEYGNQ